MPVPLLPDVDPQSAGPGPVPPAEPHAERGGQQCQARGGGGGQEEGTLLTPFHPRLTETTETTEPLIMLYDDYNNCVLMVCPVPPQRYPTDKAYFIAKEILTTERTYLKDLEVITVVRLLVFKQIMWSLSLDYKKSASKDNNKNGQTK